MTVLIVCTGNICRSPMAAAILEHLLQACGIDDIEVRSAGTAPWDGAPASEGSYLVSLEHGLDLSSHRSRHLTTDIVAHAALILGMGASHVDRASQLGGAGKSYLLGEYAGQSAEDAEVADPFGGELEEYRATYDRLLSLLEAALPRLIAERPDADPGQH
jgi:protein-tyrosine-phosphatase